MMKNFKILLILLIAMLSCQVMAETQYDAQILKVSPDDVEGTIKSLEKEGVKILHHRDNLLLAFIPVGDGSAEARAHKLRGKIPAIERMERGRRAIPTLDSARRCYGADRIGRGEGLDIPYTGKGVVTGFCDIGFDPMHIAFFDEKGNSRVKRVVHYEESLGKRTVLEGVAQYKPWGIDEEYQTHATHVCGIMAGGYKGNDFYGTAPESDIVATVSQCSDVGLLSGMEDIIEYAKEVGKPAVINMSMSTYVGPRDGTSLFCQYLDKMGHDAIICISSGNNGSYPTTLSADFSDKVKSLKTLVQTPNPALVHFDVNGMMDVWSRDTKPFKVRLTCSEWGKFGQDVFTLPWVEIDREQVSVALDPKNYAIADTIFSGQIYIEGGINSENGRRYADIYFSTHTDQMVSPQHRWNKYWWGLEVQADPGAHVDVHADQGGTLLLQCPGYPEATNYQNINDMVTGQNTICVGMYVSKERALTLSGDVFDYNEGFKRGEVDLNSSFGTLADGRVLPHTVAPGNLIISAFSKSFCDMLAGDDPNAINYEVMAKTTADGRDHCWGPNAGTSMACPYVAGYIATWLQLNPNLTVEEARKLIIQSNDTTKSLALNPRNGQGWFRPYEGIKALMGVMSSAPGIIGNDTFAPKVQWTGTQLRVWNPASLPAELRIYTLDGRLVADMTLGDDQVRDIDVTLASGTYLAAVTTPTQPTTTIKFIKK